MHSFKHKGWIINYNPDMSGDVEITHETELVERIAKREVTLPGELLQAFMGELIRTRRIAMIEQMSDDELLRL